MAVGGRTASNEWTQNPLPAHAVMTKDFKYFCLVWIFLFNFFFYHYPLYCLLYYIYTCIYFEYIILKGFERLKKKIFPSYIVTLLYSELYLTYSLSYYR